MDQYVEVSVEELATADIPRGGDFTVVGSGVVRGVRFGDRLLRSFSVETPGREPLHPRFLIRHPERRTVRFVDCDFSGLRCARFQPDIAQFERCDFSDVRLSTKSIMSAHFQDCIFSGQWNAIFSGRRDALDPYRRVTFSGNDFSGLRGFDLRHVDLAAQSFDPASQIPLRRGDPLFNALAKVAEVELALHAEFENMAEEIEHIAGGQMLLVRENFPGLFAQASAQRRN